MLIAPIIAQVQTVTVLKSVEGVVEFALAQQSLKGVPAAFVVPLMDSATPNRMLSGAVEQRVAERFGVILAVSNVRDQRGQAANEDLEGVRKSVIAALLGWQPAAGYDPVEYGGGRMLSLINPVLWWQLEFTTAYIERKV